MEQNRLFKAEIKLETKGSRPARKTKTRLIGLVIIDVERTEKTW
jgi:hypothetical protein